MRSISFVTLLILVVLFVVSQNSAATGVIRVDETRAKLSFDKNPCEFSFTASNQTGESKKTKIFVELLSPQNLLRGFTVKNVTIETGENNIAFPVTFYTSDETSAKDFIWYRLNYKIYSADDGEKFAEGTLSFSEIASDIFELQAVGSDYAKEGQTYRAYTRAFHPLTQKPVANIPVESVVTLEENSKKEEIKANAITDDDGFAVFEFKFPKKLFFDDALITFNARRGSFFQTVKNRLTTLNDPSWYLQTDKPLYQPGQKIYIRSLVFNPSKTASENKEGRLRITDPEGTTVFSTELKSSRFGIANVEWRLPDNLRLGIYGIHIDTDDGRAVSKTFTVSRYDMPNFIVNVKPDKPFYLPKQNAKVEIRADYLFGQPVTKGTVRVVRETERTWNYREQKWETEEAETYQGKTDSSGKFTAKINLKDKYENLDDNYDDYEDLNFVAYFTDDSTKRTEQRRFDLRISKEPIHVRIIGVPIYQNKNLPIEFYLTTFYADGTPAVCDLTLSEMDSDDTDAKTIRTQKLNKTNQYGAAKISDLKIKPNEADDAYIKITARDANNKVGHQTESIDFDEDPAILVSTDKTIYRPNEPVKLEIVSSEKAGVLFVDVANNQQSVYSIQTRLSDGKASLTIPYKADFKGNLTIIAFSNFGEDSFTTGSRIIVYPSPNDLKIALQTASETHRPGDSINVNFDVKSAEGNGVETALGVVVFDKAVAERARTDGNNGGFLSSVGYLLGYSDESIGNIIRKDVDKVDLTKPIPSDFDLTVEAMLNSDAENNVTNLDDDRYSRQQAKIQSNVFRESFQKQFEPIEKAISEHYRKTYEYPKDLESLSRILKSVPSAVAGSVSTDIALRDPWGVAYRIDFSIEAANDQMTFTSSGADKKFGTDDDYTASDLSWGYYRQAGQKIDAVMREYHQRTGGFIRDEKNLLAELKNSDFDSRFLSDRWGVPYKFVFSVYETKYVCGLISSGVDKKWATPKDDESDDFVVWSNSFDYFEKDGVAIAKILDKELRTNGVLPKTKAEFTKTLKSNGVDFASLKDGWNRGFYVTFKTDSRYTNRVTEVPTEDGKDTRKVYTPITQESAVITIRSKGEDGKEGTEDDFTAKTFSIVVSEKSATDTTGIVIDYKKILSSNTGTITGTIKDTANNFVSDASVSISNLQTPYEDTAITNTEGKFEFNNVPVGFYGINVNASGYDSTTNQSFEVLANVINEFNATLSPTAEESENFIENFWLVRTGGSNVSYGGGGPGGGGIGRRDPFSLATVSRGVINTDSYDEVVSTRTEFVTAVSGQRGLNTNITVDAKSGTLATPRLREYFPETLLWQPEVITDAQGKVHLNFKLADNITTWNLIALGTTLDGQVGVAEKEIRAFQPFFIENDPPKDLTVGDEISFPIVVRNYTDKEQAINLSLKPENWFTLKVNENQTAKVAAGNSTNVLFPFQAIKFGKEQNLRVTAQTVETADAVEKKIAVHPNGQEITNTIGGITNDSITLNTTIPNDVIEATTQAELRIYPNLMSHVLESVENIMARPYGCAEQTISAAYPSVIVLKQQGRNATVRERVNVTDTLPHSRVSAKAERYAREGYEKLLGYSTADGGFTYWGRGEADLALTAYAVRFLFDAKDVIEIDETVLDKAREFLIKKQNANGSWGNGDDKQNALITAYIARILAMSVPPAVADGSQVNKPPTKTVDTDSSIKRSLTFLHSRVDASDEPQFLALYSLTAAEMKDTNEAQRINARLEKLALNEGTGSYWALELNTPFYGWGLAGRIETTALVIQSLSTTSNNKDLINRGLLFLLKQKDRYGVWYSTQATINVLDALIALLSKSENTNNENNEASIFVNGKFAQAISLSSNDLIRVNLSNFMVTGENKIEVKQSNNNSATSVQLVTSYYSHWQTTETESIKRNNSSALRFSALYNKAETKIGDEITCNVEAERIGFRGYGMLLAEIGLPPGADVDRASLDKAMAESGYAFSRYDVLPDRIIVYLWAKAGGVKFSFKLKLRFGIKAQTASSQLYDYYNPEARVVIAPTKFVVM